MSAGRIGWLELNAQRVTQAMPFYQGLFGWGVEVLHARPFGALPLIANGDWVFANQFMAMGAFAAPRWMVWLRGDVDRAAARIAALGGDVGRGVYEIGGHGRRLDAADPQGHGFGVIAPETPGPDLDRPGDPVTAELWSPQAGAMAPFYADVLGLAADGPALVGAAGPVLWLRDTEAEIAPPRWIPYFRSLGVEADAERARRLGAIEQVPLAELPGIGRLVVLDDPAGAYFGLVDPG